MRFFGDKLKLSCIMEVPHERCRPRIILNLLAELDEGMPNVNDTTDREVALDSMQFWRTFHRILQAIWEADPSKRPARVTKIDVADASHHGIIWTSQVVSFAYVIPLAADNDSVIIFVNMVLLMGWVGSPNFFCVFSETLADVVNALVHTSIPVPEYRFIAKITEKAPCPPHNLDRLAYIN